MMNLNEKITKPIIFSPENACCVFTFKNDFCSVNNNAEFHLVIEK